MNNLVLAALYFFPMNNASAQITLDLPLPGGIVSKIFLD